jgi:archaellum biogenesis protein FlaJ (TadC family)
MAFEDLSAEQQSALDQLAVQSNDKLQETGSMATSHALNLGCSMSLVPSLIILILVFLISRGNWVALGIAATLVILAAVTLASLLATVARKRAVQREYELNIQPEIERQLRDIPGGWDAFQTSALQALPADAALLEQIGVSPVET